MRRDKIIIAGLFLLLLGDQIRIIQLSSHLTQLEEEVLKFKKDFIQYATSVNGFMNDTNGSMKEIEQAILTTSKSINTLAGAK